MFLQRNPWRAVEPDGAPGRDDAPEDEAGAEGRSFPHAVDCAAATGELHICTCGALFQFALASGGPPPG